MVVENEMLFGNSLVKLFCYILGLQMFPLMFYVFVSPCCSFRMPEKGIHNAIPFKILLWDNDL